jgi:hypothetical protein
MMVMDRSPRLLAKQFQNRFDDNGLEIDNIDLRMLLKFISISYMYHRLQVGMNL